MRNFFNPEKGIWKLLGYFGEFLLLSLLWFLCSVPLITVGASCTALYDTVYHCVRREESDFFHRFFETFRTEFRNSVPSTLLWSAVLILLICFYRWLSPQLGVGRIQDILRISLLFLGLVPAGIVSWVFPLLSRFRFSFPELTKTAVQLALSRIFRTLLLGALIVGTVLVCIYTLLPVMFLPGILALLQSFLIEPVFEAYLN